MPANKDFKRLVRARMGKTGEAYTTARAQLLKRPQRRTSAPAPEPAPQPAAAPDYAGLAGMADATIAARTGCTWERWVHALDRVGAHEWAHRDIARYVHEKYKVPDWWTQAVTVGYERIKGLRAIGQRRGGGYEASKSKVFAVPVARLYRAFHEAPLAGRDQAHRPDRHRGEVDAHRVARRHRGGPVLRGEGSGQEPAGDSAPQIGRQGLGGSDEGMVGRATRRAGRAAPGYQGVGG